MTTLRRLSELMPQPNIRVGQTIAANHPMQPSGEVGRFEVDDQPSPPGDR